MNRTKIEWATHSWNPIKGLCPEDCKTPDGKSYCYSRRMYQRFKWDPTPRINPLEMLSPMSLREKGKRIFVCSTFELFHPAIEQDWRDQIFEIIEFRKSLTFIVLTKRPERIDRPMPANVWLGVTVTGPDDLWRIDKLLGAMARIRFVSFEPLLAEVTALPYPKYGRLMVDWIVAGRMTGYGKKNDPKRAWIERIVAIARTWEVRVFLKDNLAGIWGGRLVQEFPE